MRIYKIILITSILTGILPGNGVLAALNADFKPEKLDRMESWKTPNVEKKDFLPNGKFKGLKERKTGPVWPVLGRTSRKSVSEILGRNISSSPTLLSQTQSQELIQSQAFGPNLIQNPSVETNDSTGFPVAWRRGGYGTNSRTFIYPVAGFNSPRGIQTSITNYTSGDSKWFFNDVSVTPGHTYQFSDNYISNTTSFVDIRYTMQNGTFTYSGVASLPPSSGYTNASFAFTVPAGAVSITIFHDIASVGTLTTDEFSLNDMATSPPPPPVMSNLISNGDFEIAGTNGNPSGWGRGRFGTNIASFTYPVTGVNSSKAARISLTSYTSGDAKWFFSPISVAPGIYTYSDQYLSDIPSVITVQYHLTNGAFVFTDISNLSSAGQFTPSSVDFSVPANVADITVFHLIEGVGSLTIDNASLVKKSDLTGIFSTGAVSLTFDDALVSQYQNALPKLASSGLKGTFFFATRQFSDFGFPAHISKAQVKDIFNAGHEIGAHTQTHVDLTTLTDAGQQAEIQGSRDDLLAMNVGPITSFAYPFGNYNATTLQLVKNAGFTAGRNTIVKNVTPTSDPFQLPATSIQSTMTVAQIEGMIDNAIASKQWVILTFHQIDTSGGKYSITPSNFNQVIDYIVSKGVPVVTVSQGIQNLQ